MSWPGAARQRAGLPPAGHPAVDQRRVRAPAARRARGRGAPSPRAGSPRAGRRPARPAPGPRRRSSSSLRSRAIERLPRSSSEVRAQRAHQAAAAPAPVDPDDVGAEVGQEHAAERPRPQPGELDDPHALAAVPTAAPPLPRAAVVRPFPGHAAGRRRDGPGRSADDGLRAGRARRRTRCAGPLGVAEALPLPRRLAVGDAAGQPHRLPAARRPPRGARRPLPRAPTWLRPFLAVGVLGGYTTYSTFAVEVVQPGRGRRGG